MLLPLRLIGIAGTEFSTAPVGRELKGSPCSWAVSRASAMWIKSRQAMLKSPCLPYGYRCFQHLDYVSISDGLLHRRGLEVTQQFQPEGFQILDSLETHVGRIRRRIVESFYTLTTQPPATCFLFAPQNDGARRGKNPRPLWQQFESVSNLFTDEINTEVGRNAMHVNEANIYVLSAAVGLPSLRQPRLRNVPTEENMQMSVTVFLEFKHADEGKRTLELPRQRNTEFSPTVSDIAISMLAVLRREFLGVKRQRRHAR